MTPKIEIVGQKYAHFCGFEGSFWTILVVEKVVFRTFTVVLELFRQCLGNIFSFKRPIFSPLGFREALKNVDNDSPGLFIVFGFLAPMTISFIMRTDGRTGRAYLPVHIFLEKACVFVSFLSENFNFWGHLSTFRTENTTKSRPSQVKNNA